MSKYEDKLGSPIKDNIPSDEIDIKEIVSIFWSTKFTIILITLIFAASSVFYATSLPNFYKSEALLKLSDNQNSGSSSLASSYGDLASRAGISIPNEGNNQAEFAMKVMKSRSFLKHLLDSHDILPSLMAPKYYDASSKKLILDSEIYNKDKGGWMREKPKYGDIIPSHLEVYETAFQAFSVSKDRDSGFISIEFEHLSPVFAKKFLELVILELNNVVRLKDMNESMSSLDFLREQFSKTQEKDIRFSISKLIESQLNTHMLASVRKEYLVNEIEKPFIPEFKSSPSRAIICITITLIGGIFSLIFVLIKHFMRKSKLINN